MIRRLAPLSLAFALTGCGSYEVVWLVEIGAIVGTDPTVAITHNFLNAAPEVDDVDDEWTTTQTSEASNSLTFAEIFDVDGGDRAERAMVAGGTVIPGTQNDDGLWVFTWTNREAGTSTESHVSGYAYTEGQDTSVTWTVTLDLDAKKEETTGTFDLALSQIGTFTETDLFSTTETEMAFGQIPAESYLDHTTEGNFVFNSADATECSGNPCSITATITASGTAPITAWETSIEPNGFDGIDEAEQEAGIPEDLFNGM